jgi:hypothetical protein
MYTEPSPAQPVNRLNRKPLGVDEVSFMREETTDYKREYQSKMKIIRPLNVIFATLFIIYISIYPILKSIGLLNTPFMKTISLILLPIFILTMVGILLINKCPNCKTNLAIVIINRSNVNYCPYCGEKLT